MKSWTLIDLDEVDSTNNKAMQMLKKNYNLHRSVVYAAKQTAGKGQKKRKWVSDSGNSYSTYILEASSHFPWSNPQKAALLGIVTAVSIGASFKELGIPLSDIFYKWPNDVWLKKAKVAGILPELHLSNQNQVKAAIVGAGVNLLSSPNNLGRSVTSLYESYQIAVLPQDYLKIYLKKLDEYLEVWKNQSIEPLMDIWKANSHSIGELLKVKIYDKEIFGQFYDFSNDGSLILRSAYGELLTIRAGEVFFNS